MWMLPINIIGCSTDLCGGGAYWNFCYLDKTMLCEVMKTLDLNMKMKTGNSKVLTNNSRTIVIVLPLVPHKNINNDPRQKQNNGKISKKIQTVTKGK